MMDAHIHIERGPYMKEWINRKEDSGRTMFAPTRFHYRKIVYFDAGGDKNEFTDTEEYPAAGI